MNLDYVNTLLSFIFTMKLTNKIKQTTGHEGIVAKERVANSHPRFVPVRPRGRAGTYCFQNPHRPPPGDRKSGKFEDENEED